MKPFSLLPALGACSLLTNAVFAWEKSANGTCTLIPHGSGRDDSQQFQEVINATECTTIVLPQPYTYSIQQRLYTDITNKNLHVYGRLLFSDDLEYWINNSWMTDFQNLLTAWILTGSNWTLSGGGFAQGGIDGNGQPWYTRAAGVVNQPGRPMSLYIFNASDSLVKDFSVVQPQFWAFFVSQSHNITLDGVLVNATNHDPAAPVPDPNAVSHGYSWVINTDGIDTYRSDSINIQNWVVQNGEDCVSFKGNSTNINVRNITCIGSRGFAVGSVGQYPDRFDNIINVSVKDVTMHPTPNVSLTGVVYFKNWIGEEIGTPPNGGGGGSGHVSNLTFENFAFQEADQPVYIQTCLTYSDIDTTNLCNTSKVLMEDVTFINFQGNSSGTYNGTLVDLNCSSSTPCRNFNFIDWSVTAPEQFEPVYDCINAENITGITCGSS
ncbi:hypothetical protein D9758_007293 [Tetrapyrgos nigripes]|uniref:galacturonan 1,4-alpha-galacturonidase n=1 Tax=Tetrapyrgos nigripes TaxID=182062 RepID=A0A8H5GB76_9AGAR|nr:hypothetical protein D9758_007293 [Tetrapyrgos nigripes]